MIKNGIKNTYPQKSFFASTNYQDYLVWNGLSQNSGMAYYHPYKLLVIITFIYKGKCDKKIFLSCDLLIFINEIGQYPTLFSQYFHMWWCEANKKL